MSIVLKQKEMDDAVHLERAALDGCRCEVCLAVQRVILKVLQEAAANLCGRCRSGMPVNSSWYHDKCDAFEVLEMMREYEVSI